MLHFGMGAMHVQREQLTCFDVGEIALIAKRLVEPVGERFAIAMRVGTAGRYFTGVRNGKIQRGHGIRANARKIIQRQARFRVAWNPEPSCRIRTGN